MLITHPSTLEAIINKAQAAAKDGYSALPELPAFVESLYTNVVLEDIERIPAPTLAQIAKEVFDDIKRRQPGVPSIYVTDLDYIPEGASTSHTLTAITIINDDMPFLVDSIMGYLQEAGQMIHLVLHPILDISRDDDGDQTGFHGRAKGKAKVGKGESVIRIHVDRISDSQAIDAVRDDLMSILERTRVVVADWQDMRQRLHQSIGAYKYNPPPVSRADIDEAIAFLEWLVDDNFTFLGMREYTFVAEEDESRMDRNAESALGILRDPDMKVLRRGSEMVTMTPEIREFLTQPQPLIVTKANMKSMVHRRVYMDYVGVKQFDAHGQLKSELRVVGLFTSTAYTKSVHSIPYLRRKVDAVLEQSGLDAGSHSSRKLMNVLENYPRDELFQIDTETLFEFAHAIELLDERPRVRVLSRVDKFDRFVSVMVFVPRDRFNTDVRMQIGEYLVDAYEGHLSAFYPSYPDGPLARIHYIIGRRQGQTPDIPQHRLEDAVMHIIRTWEDSLRGMLMALHDPATVTKVFTAYKDAFDPSYQHAFTEQQAVEDISIIEKMSEDNQVQFRFRSRRDTDDVIDLKIFSYGRPIPLSERMPIIENLGFSAINERTYRVQKTGAPLPPCVWIHDVSLSRPDGQPIAIHGLADQLTETLMAIINGDAEADGFNALTLHAGLTWREISILRAYGRYMRQIPLPYSQDYIWETLRAYPKLAQNCVRLFYLRFGTKDTPKAITDDAVAEQDVSVNILEILEGVNSLDEDRILRTYLLLLNATLRTNFFQRDEQGRVRPALSLKFDPAMIEGLPEPRPYREIFVYSPRVEGVHLRGGAIARGGLRWSDRPQDFRTEILGLAKAQQVKNAVIVPVGAKGGFVPKHLPVGGSREAVFEEGRDSYKVFIASLLDVTDNLDDTEIVPPQSVVRHDGDDPYLVVAADKGTATFSDTANAISEERGHWLGDAFASGGSAGYDHKKMGITARGGWEAVKRHFREIDIDIQTTPFTVVGCGDMSGDVFGNGMLLSEQIKLVAAFDHRDIFIDPDPDPAISFAERKRLFDMGRSSWQDYNKDLISEGGGVFSRGEKTITLPDRARALLNLEKSAATPFEIIKAIVQANADLLWFGGIGTYVRASSESDGDVGDRANDPVRVSAKDLNVKVVGEGANLGMTQLARIEFALNGGRVNSDAIDNSAGVNSSDVEVNIKIALGAAERAGKLTREDRNVLLETMTDDVAELVLFNNYQQTLTISLAESRGLEFIDFQARMMRSLESEGLLDRDVEFLPNTEALNERIEDGQALTRPELAVLLAYAKIALYQSLLSSTLPDDPYFEDLLVGYFPPEMRQTYDNEIKNHRLRREIIATLLSNSIINRGGPSVVHRLADQTGAQSDEIAKAFALTRESYRLRATYDSIDTLDNKISGAKQLELYRRVQDLLTQQVLWYLRHADMQEEMGALVSLYRDGIDALTSNLSALLPERFRVKRQGRIDALVSNGAPQDIATRIVDTEIMATGPDIILIDKTSSADLETAAQVYYKVGAFFGLDNLLGATRRMNTSDYFERLALNGAFDSFLVAQRILTCRAIEEGVDDVSLETLPVRNRSRLKTTHETLGDIAADPAPTISKLTVASSLLMDLTR